MATEKHMDELQRQTAVIFIICPMRKKEKTHIQTYDLIKSYNISLRQTFICCLQVEQAPV